MKGRLRKFGEGMRDSKASYASGVRLGNAKSQKWLHRATGGRCDMGGVEGAMPKARMDRPGRKHGGKVAKPKTDHDEDDDGWKHGGSVKKKADGGWVGEGDSGKKLREDADDLDKGAKAKVTNGFGKAALGAAGTGFFRLGKSASGMGDRAAKVGSIGVLGSGLGDMFEGMKDSTTARRKYNAADKAEGRKSGGKVKK